MSGDAPMEFNEHRVETHTRETDLSMVYTINPAVVDDYINSVEQLLAGDKYKGSASTSSTPPVVLA